MCARADAPKAVRCALCWASNQFSPGFSVSINVALLFINSDHCKSSCILSTHFCNSAMPFPSTAEVISFPVTDTVTVVIILLFAPSIRPTACITCAWWAWIRFEMWIKLLACKSLLSRADSPASGAGFVRPRHHCTVATESCDPDPIDDGGEYLKRVKQLARYLTSALILRLVRFAFEVACSFLTDTRIIQFDKVYLFARQGSNGKRYLRPPCLLYEQISTGHLPRRLPCSHDSGGASGAGGVSRAPELERLCWG